MRRLSRIATWIGRGLLALILGFGIWFFVANPLAGPDVSAFGPARAVDCRAVTVLDPSSGQPIVGIEDIAISRAQGYAILSAFDRSKVLSGATEAPISQGGLYAIALAEVEGQLSTASKPATLQAVQLSSSVAEGRPFHPHGIDIHSDGTSERLFVVNQAVTADERGRRRTPAIEAFDLTKDPRDGSPRLTNPMGPWSDRLLCQPNDIAATGLDSAVVTNDHGHCAGIGRTLETAFGLRGSYVMDLAAGEFSQRPGRFRFANGITGGRHVIVGETRGRALWRYAEARSTPEHFADAPGPVDNVTRDLAGRPVVAILPPLIRLGLHRAGAPGFEPAPSLILRWPATDAVGSAPEVLFQDDGMLFSAATVGVVHDGLLLAGSATDSGILACRLP